MAEAVAALEPEAVAVVLLHAYRHPDHERALGEALARRLPGVHVSLSHEVVGTFREYERAATTEVDASLSPLLAAYLRRLAARARGGRPSGAVDHAVERRADRRSSRRPAHAAVTVLSGPAGGAAGAAFVAAAAGEPDVLCFDMGGTSCDVCVVEGGRVRETAGREIGGRPLALPMLDVHTVGAGGGSIAWRDAGRRPARRAALGGRPAGPAAYGRGGTEPTVTDANLVLGLPRRRRPRRRGRARPRRRGAARSATWRASSTSTCVECAEGIARVANAEMVRALRVMTVERGVDPRGYALLAFGGAGPMHAARDRRGARAWRAILCPRTSGVLAALGLVVARPPPRRPAQRAPRRRRADPRCGRARRSAAGLGGGEPRRRVRRRLRYRGQAFELPVERDGTSPTTLREAFAAALEEALRLRRRRGRGRAGHAARHRGAPRPRGVAGARRRRGVSARRLAAAGRRSTAPPWRPRSGAASLRPARDSPVRRCASCPRPRSSSRPAGPATSTPRARCSWSAHEPSIPSPSRCSSAPCARRARRWARRSSARLTRRTSRSAATPRRALFDPGADGHAGRAHPRPPRGDARGGGGHPRRGPRARASLGPQRPVQGRDAPPRHHRHHAASSSRASCSASPPTAPITPTSAGACRAPCRPTPHARGGGRGDRADAARRRDDRRPGRAHAPARPAPRRPPCPARDQPHRGAAGGGAGERVGADRCARRWTPSSTTPSGARARASTRCPTAPPRRATSSRRATATSSCASPPRSPATS